MGTSRYNQDLLVVQLHNGFSVHGVLKDYFPDKQTGGWASLIVWENPDYQMTPPGISR